MGFMSNVGFMVSAVLIAPALMSYAVFRIKYFNHLM
jgi:hypothetical protein